MFPREGYFHKAIVQSGSSFSPWAFTADPLKNAFELAASLGYVGDSKDRKGLFQFFMKIPAQELLADNFYKTHKKVGL